ncbi:hypothetical protein [Elstera litoralis]|nr:hypothetical protein [Elstera litoralis]
MAKSQKRNSREAKKPKATKTAAAAPATTLKGSLEPLTQPKKK